MSRNEMIAIASSIGCAISCDEEPQHGGFTLRTWTLAEPTRELAARTIVRTRLLPESADHVAVVDGEIVAVTSLGYVERLSPALEPIASTRVPWSVLSGTSQGRRVIVDHRGKVGLVDLAVGSVHSFEVDRADSDAASECAALDPTGRHLVYGWYGRYRGRSGLVRRELDDTQPQDAVVTMDDEITSLAIAPGGARIAAVTAGETAIVLAPQRIPDPDGILLIAADQLVGTWRRDSPGTLRAAFLDEFRVVLVGRAEASIRSTVDGAELATVTVDGEHMVAIDDGVVWTRTASGFRSNPL